MAANVIAATANGGSATAAQLDRLVKVGPGEHWVVSCYLKLEPRDRTRGKYLIKIKNRVKQVEEGLARLDLGREAQEGILRDLERVQQHLRNPGNLPATQGIAIFACGAIDLFEVIALPLVYRSRLLVDRTPQVRELASVEEEFGRLLTAVVDRTSGRLFEVTAFGAHELPGIRAESTRGSRYHGDQNGPGGWGEHTYHNRIREEKQRHYEEIGRELFAVDRKRPARGIVLAGTGADAGAVEPFLHTYLADRLIGTVKLNPKDTSAAEVHAATLAVREAHERELERGLVQRMTEAVGTRWAVNGLKPTLRALARGQVRSLLVHPDATQPGFRCGDTGQLVLAARACTGEGEAVPVLDVVDDAIEEALRQGIDVNVVYDEDANQAIEGLAALLRFR